MPVVAVGLITEPAQAEAVLADGQADAVALARALLWDPRWPWHAAAALGAQAAASPQYLRGAPHGASRVLVPATGSAGWLASDCRVAWTCRWRVPGARIAPG